MVTNLISIQSFKTSQNIPFLSALLTSVSSRRHLMRLKSCARISIYLWAENNPGQTAFWQNDASRPPLSKLPSDKTLPPDCAKVERKKHPWCLLVRTNRSGSGPLTIPTLWLKGQQGGLDQQRLSHHSQARLSKPVNGSLWRHQRLRHRRARTV